MLGEAFYYQRRNERVNIYDSCACVPDALLPCSRIFHMNGKSLVWPVSTDGNILMQSVDLSNIGADQEVCSFFSSSWGTGGCYVYVGCKRADGTENGKCHLHVYGLTASDEVSYLQDLKLGYKPMELSELFYSSNIYMCVVGSDKDVHVYEVEAHTGKVFRSSTAEGVKAAWRPMLGIGDSLCLRMLSEHSGAGQQCVAAFSDGYLYWHAKREIKDRDGVADGVAEAEIVGFSVKPELFWAAVLLDNAVTCVCFYGRSRSFSARKRNFFQRVGAAFSCNRCEIVIAGLANGSLLLLSVNLESNECIVLTGLDESHLGAVTAIATGDITGKGHRKIPHGQHLISQHAAGNSIDDIVVGYYDGTVKVLSVHEEFFASTVGRSSSFVDETGSVGSSLYENENMALNEEFHMSLPFPIVGLAFGSFLSPAGNSGSGCGLESPPVQTRQKSVSFADDELGDSYPTQSRSTAQTFFGEQLAVLTSRDFRLFVSR